MFFRGVRRALVLPPVGSLLNVRVGSRLCENYFLATETKYLFMKLAFAAIMSRPHYLLDSIIAQTDSASAFLHSLGQKRKSSVDLGMSALGGRADLNFGRLDVCY